MSAPAGSLEVLRAAERRPAPWKNGGGLTHEVAVHPPGSGLADFDWRVSIADIRAAGPFSLFPGIDRRMAVVSGRLSLAVDGQAMVVLTPESEPLVFPGDVPAFAEPLAGPVTDLNVMTRRSRCTGSLRRESTGQGAVLEPSADTTLIVALADLIVRGERVEVALSRLDALKIGCGAACSVTARSGPASFHVIEVS